VPPKNAKIPDAESEPYIHTKHTRVLQILEGMILPNQGARRRRLITLAILSLPVIQVGKPPLWVP
jgi:hypothetical protein